MRRPFGGNAATVLVDETGINGGAVVHWWTSEVGGTEVTDLVAADGVTPIPPGGVVSDTNGVVPDFYGPDETTRLYADAGRGRVLVLANDLDQRIANTEAAVTSLAARVTTVEQTGGGGGGVTGGFDGGTT
jgi:hypothetical protein